MHNRKQQSSLHSIENNTLVCTTELGVFKHSTAEVTHSTHYTHKHSTVETKCKATHSMTTEVAIYTFYNRSWSPQKTKVGIHPQYSTTEAKCNRERHKTKNCRIHVCKLEPHQTETKNTFTLGHGGSCILLLLRSIIAVRLECMYTHRWLWCCFFLGHNSVEHNGL